MQHLVWDLESRTWRIPGILLRRLGPRSYLVQMPSGRQLRRDRAQLQVRPDDVVGDDYRENDVDQDASGGQSTAAD
jgi:hypothetical protein